MLLISLVATAGAVAGSYVSAKVSTGFGRDLRSAIFARTERLSVHQFARFGSQCRPYAPIYRQVTLTALRARMVER